MKIESILAYVTHMQENVEHYRPIIENSKCNSYKRIMSVDECLDITEEEYQTIRDLPIPFREKIDADFSTFISGNGAYVGGLRRTIADKNGNDILINVGPGETDSFGWLSGKIRLTYTFDDGLLVDYVIFG